MTVSMGKSFVFSLCAFLGHVAGYFWNVNVTLSSKSQIQVVTIVQKQRSYRVSILKSQHWKESAVWCEEQENREENESPPRIPQSNQSEVLKLFPAFRRAHGSCI